MVLPAPFEPISPVNSPAPTLKLTLSRTLRPDSDTLTPSTPRTSGAAGSAPSGPRHRCSVDTPLATAFWIAWTSASIQDW